MLDSVLIVLPLDVFYKYNLIPTTSMHVGMSFVYDCSSEDVISIISIK